MTLQRFPGTFASIAPPGIGGYSIADIINLATASNYQSTWTPGATLVQDSGLSSPETKPYEIQSVGITGYLAMAAAPQTYGKIGKLIAGIIPPTQPLAPTRGSPTIPYTTSILPLPDPTLTVTLWDPEIDPCPPVYPIPGGQAGKNTILGGFLPVSAQLQLPQSVQLLPGEGISIGLWQFPSLIGSALSATALSWQIQLNSAIFAILYDDGLL